MSREHLTPGFEAANQVRLDRAKFRMRVEAGEVAVWKVIEDPPSFCARVTVFDFLTWIPGIGKTRGSLAFKLLRKARVQSHMRLGELTEWQRARLIDAVHEHAHPGKKAQFNRPLRAALRGDKGQHPAEKGWT